MHLFVYNCIKCTFKAYFLHISAKFLQICCDKSIFVAFCLQISAFFLHLNAHFVCVHNIYIYIYAISCLFNLSLSIYIHMHINACIVPRKSQLLAFYVPFLFLSTATASHQKYIFLIHTHLPWSGDPSPRPGPWLGGRSALRTAPCAGACSSCLTVCWSVDCLSLQPLL